MKQYVIDELRPDDHLKLKGYLDANFAVPGFEDLYRLPIDRQYYTEVQESHADCHPLYFALELMPERLSCELLVRTNNRIRCDCIRYATEMQRNWLIQVLDSLFERLEIMT